MTGGSGEPIFIASAQRRDPALDLSHEFVRVWIRVAEVRRLGALELRLSSDDFETNYFAFSVPLFGDPEFNVLQDGAWTAYTFGFSQARIHSAPDRSQIRSIGWLICDDGKGAADLELGSIAALESPSTGAVSLTFDDGNRSQLQAAEIMARHGFRGTAYIIPALVGMPQFMSLGELESLRDRWGWEIADHHEIPLTQMSAERLDRTLLGIQRYLLEHGFEAGHFAYPLGKIDDRDTQHLTRKYLRDGSHGGAQPGDAASGGSEQAACGERDPHLVAGAARRGRAQSARPR